MVCCYFKWFIEAEDGHTTSLFWGSFGLCEELGQVCLGCSQWLTYYMRQRIERVNLPKESSEETPNPNILHYSCTGKAR